MKKPRPLATVTVEERAEGSFVILRTDMGGQVHYGPFSPDGVEAAIMHLGSALAMTAMRYQTVLRGANFGAKLHEQGLPEETREKREEIAARGLPRHGLPEQEQIAPSVLHPYIERGATKVGDMCGVGRSAVERRRV